MATSTVTALCPTDPGHHRFVTVAHVAQDWVVDEHGNFLEVAGDLETVTAPDPANTWTCHVCGAEATVTGRS